MWDTKTTCPQHTALQLLCLYLPSHSFGGELQSHLVRDVLKKPLWIWWKAPVLLPSALPFLAPVKQQGRMFWKTQEGQSYSSYSSYPGELIEKLLDDTTETPSRSLHPWKTIGASQELEEDVQVLRWVKSKNISYSRVLGPQFSSACSWVNLSEVAAYCLGCY